MSKTTRKRRSRKKKEPIVEEPPVAIVGVNVETGELVEPTPQEPSEIEKILLTAPVLPWKIDKTYIDKDFRKAHITLLTNLMSLHNLPYNVDQTGVLTPK